MDITLLKAFSKLVSAQRIKTQENVRATHSNFNVFTTVLNPHDEVRLHTRFIHNLLNPRGSHDCGDMFLKLFFETLADNPPSPENSPTGKETPEFSLQKDFRVYKEASTKQGQIDLLIESEQVGLAVENKIYAGEQHKQLKRYSEYLESKYKEPDKHALFFLTLDGKSAISHEGAPYYRISYKEHILMWIERCLQSTYAIIPINQVLLQYRHLVRQLTGKTLEQKNMTKIKDHLIANPDLIKLRTELVQGIEEVKTHALDLFGDSLLKEIRQHHPAEFRANMVENSFGKDLFGSIRISPSSGPFATSSYQLVIEHVPKWAGLMIGIESKWRNSRLSKQEEKMLTEINQLLENECTENKIHKANPQKTWPGEFWPTGWHNLIHPWPITDEVILELLDDQKRTAFAQEMISKALLHIDRLVRLHAVAVENLRL